MRSFMLTLIAVGCASGQFRSTETAHRSSKESSVAVQIDDIQPVKAGEAFEFGFWAENATYCTIQPGGKKILVKFERTYHKAKVPGSRTTQIVKVVCVGPDGKGQDLKQVAVQTPPKDPPPQGSAPLLSLTADFPDRVESGSAAPIKYTVKNAVRCDVFGTTAKSAADNTYDVGIANLYADFHGAITCYDKDGKDKSIDVKIDVFLTPAIPDDKPPKLSLVASYPSQVLRGSSATVKYTTRNATSCDVFGNKEASHSDGEHSIALTNMQSDFSGAIQCLGAEKQSESLNVAIKVLLNPLSITLGQPNPNPVPSGEDVIVPFTIINAVKCWIMNDTNQEISPTATSHMLINVTQDTTFSLTCTGENGQPLTKSTTIQLEAPTTDLVLTLNDPPDVFFNKPAQLSYTVQNATHCSWKIDDGPATDSEEANGLHFFPVTLKRDSVVTITCENDIPQEISRSKNVVLQTVPDSPSVQLPPQNYYFLFVLDNSTSMSSVADKMAAAMDNYVQCQGKAVSSTCPYGSVFPTLLNVETHIGVINTQIGLFAPKDGAKLSREFTRLVNDQENVSRFHIEYDDNLILNSKSAFKNFPSRELQSDQPYTITYDLDVQYPGISGQPGFGDLVHYQAWVNFHDKIPGMISKLSDVRGKAYNDRKMVRNRLGTSREQKGDKTLDQQLTELIDRVDKSQRAGLQDVSSKLSKRPCGKWFSPSDKSPAQDYCFVAAFQISGTENRAEPGIMALDQLLDKYDNQGQPLFESDVLANIVFISDTQDPGLMGNSTDNAGKTFLDGVGASIVTVGGVTMAYTDYLMQKKTSSYFLDRAKQNSGIKSLTFHGIVPMDGPCSGASEPFGALTYQKMITDSGGKLVDMCTAGNDMLKSLQDIFASTRFVTKTFKSRLVIKNVVSIKEKRTGNNLTSFEISQDGKTLKINNVDVLNSPGLDISAVCYKDVLNDASCSFTSI